MARREALGPLAPVQPSVPSVPSGPWIPFSNPDAQPSIGDSTGPASHAATEE